MREGRIGLWRKKPILFVVKGDDAIISYAEVSSDEKSGESTWEFKHCTCKLGEIETFRLTLTDWWNLVHQLSSSRPGDLPERKLWRQTGPPDPPLCTPKKAQEFFFREELRNFADGIHPECKKLASGEGCNIVLDYPLLGKNFEDDVEGDFEGILYQDRTKGHHKRLIDWMENRCDPDSSVPLEVDLNKARKWFKEELGLDSVITEPGKTGSLLIGPWIAKWQPATSSLGKRIKGNKFEWVLQWTKRPTA